MTAEQHAAVLESLRDKLGKLHERGSISEQFAEWHCRLMGCLETIRTQFPSCASPCEELRALNYELAPEIEGGIPEGLPENLMMAHGSRMFFRKQCARAEELIRTILWALRTPC
jgi:hypothetical protein